MIYMWFTGINYYKPAVEKDRDSIFTTIMTIWKPGFRALDRGIAGSLVTVRGPIGAFFETVPGLK